jgi:long-chain acyl-CoA synthetase
VKNLVKLECGEYIALEHLEATYKSCNLVGNLCVHAEPNARHPIAVVFPHEINLRMALGGNKAPFPDLCKLPEAKEMILKGCNAAGRQRSFKSMEFLAGVIITPDEWTPESGLVTAAQKIQRKKIAQKFDAEIKVCETSSSCFLPSPLTKFGAGSPCILVVISLSFHSNIMFCFTLYL